MLRLIPSPRILCAIPETLQNYQTLRYARKPRKPIWLGTAKSKLFRVPVRVKYPEDEQKEYLRITNNYRTTVRSIRKFLTYRYNESLQAEADTEQVQKAFEEDFARCCRINDEWNKQLSVEREERLMKQLAEEIEFAKNRKEEILKKKEEELADLEELVKKEKEAAVYFITPEMLDDVIEKAISNPVDYNFAIDLEGNRIYGRETKPGDVVKEKS